MITQERLKELLDYDPETGIFYWRKRTKLRLKKNMIAGSLNSRGYWIIGLDNYAYKAHRLAWLYVYGKFPDFQIDHEFHCKSDNRIKFLREVTNQGNQMNAPIRSDNTSGVMGVSFVKRTNKWLAYIGINGVTKNLGSFVNFEDAVTARKNAEVEFNFHKNHAKFKLNVWDNNNTRS